MHDFSLTVILILYYILCGPVATRLRYRCPKSSRIVNVLEWRPSQRVREIAAIPERLFNINLQSLCCRSASSTIPGPSNLLYRIVTCSQKLLCFQYCCPVVSLSHLSGQSGESVEGSWKRARNFLSLWTPLTKDIRSTKKALENCGKR